MRGEDFPYQIARLITKLQQLWQCHIGTRLDKQINGTEQKGHRYSHE